MELFENLNEEQRRLSDIIDHKFLLDYSKEEIRQYIYETIDDTPTLLFCLAFIEWRDQQLKESNPFDDDLDDDEEEEQKDAMSSLRSIYYSAQGFYAQNGHHPSSRSSLHISQLRTDSAGNEYAELGEGVRMYCAVDNLLMQHRVHGVCTSFNANECTMLHIDLELPETLPFHEIIVHVVAHHSTSLIGDIVLDADQVKSCMRDGRLRIEPIQLSSLFDRGYTDLMNDVENDDLWITIGADARTLGSHKIRVDGLFIKEKEPLYDILPPIHPDARSLDDWLDVLGTCIGWDALGDHIYKLIKHWHDDMERARYGLPSIPMSLHTMIMGNPGTGKSMSVPYLSGTLASCSLLKSATIVRTSFARITSSRSADFYSNTMEVIKKAQGGVLLFENAHEMYSPESRTMEEAAYIISALTEAMEDTRSFPFWALVMVGETEGMEQLTAYFPALKKYFPNPVVLPDFTPDELFEIAERFRSENGYVMSEQVKDKLKMFIQHQYNLRGPDFQNGTFVKRLFTDKILPSMDARLYEMGGNVPIEWRREILLEDIPSVSGYVNANLAELDQLVGLNKLKTKIRDYLYTVQLAGQRMERGMTASMPRLHMVFLGNPGTGKTTVAEIIGKVFASWGILSRGEVIRTEKSKLVGRYLGETEHNMKMMLSRARGNILFIDEAYQLAEGGEKDYGRIVMDSLLTELGKERQDMVVILAGYTAPMKTLLESNEGIESRFPNVFNFEDFSVDELLQIGKMMLAKQKMTLTPGAEANMRAIIEEAAGQPSPRFGNGRFVSNLINNDILSTMGARVAQLEHPDDADLSTILPEDVVVGKALKEVVFDDAAIDAALARLDAMAGLKGVKTAIHSFVQTARYLHSIGEPYVGKGLLSWRFIGKSGTGKSSVAEIMAAILKGMRLIANSHITEVKGERIFNATETDCDKVLKEAVKRSCNGLIFIDVDDKVFRNPHINYGRSIEQVRLKMAELTVEVGGECALILAELDAPNRNMAEQLSDAGIYEFDHTLLFADFTVDELFSILCDCLKKHKVTFAPDAEEHIKDYLSAMRPSVDANARTMKLMSRTIYQQVILRESTTPAQSPSSTLPAPPPSHQVQLSDVATFRWNTRKGKIGF